MPIRPEMKARYPKDWKLRSKFIRFYRAKNHCEACGVRNHSVGYRDDDGVFHVELECPKDYKEANELVKFLNQGSNNHYIVIVLTTAHLFDHRPEACNFLNLAALCQKCHNGHDAKMRQQNRRERLALESPQLNLCLN